MDDRLIIVTEIEGREEGWIFILLAPAADGAGVAQGKECC